MTSIPAPQAPATPPDQSETVQSLYENYNDYNKTLRAWFVSFGLGGPALFLVRPELVTSLRNAEVLTWTIGPFLFGCGCQIIIALINKYYAYYYYDSKVSSKPLHWFWEMIGEWFWLDMVFDLLTVAAFTGALWVMVDVLVFTSPSVRNTAAVTVIDGNTIRIGSEQLRIMGADTPALGDNAKCDAERNLAEIARDKLTQMIMGSASFEIDRHGVDQFGRTLADIRVNGSDVADLLIGERVALRSRGQQHDWCTSRAPVSAQP